MITSEVLPESVEYYDGIEADLAGIRSLSDDTSGTVDQLKTVWMEYSKRHQPPGQNLWSNHPFMLPIVEGFVALANTVLDDPDALRACKACYVPHWHDDVDFDSEGNPCCEPCREKITVCSRCDFWEVGYDDFRYLNTGEYYCDGCTDRYASYCDHCEEYYPDSNGHDFDHEDDDDSCGCAPQPLNFIMPANSHGTIVQDERLLVELPAGHLDERAIGIARDLLWSEQFNSHWRKTNENAMNAGEQVPPWAESIYTAHEALTKVMNGLEPVWQAKQGNFTRRLSKVLFQEFGMKLAAGLLSQVGSSIRAHTSKQNTWHLEFTRDLNQSASAFFHEDSCWWGSESYSRCALKHWGGLGLRTYADENVNSAWPTGRAWVQPLNKNMEPTVETLNAHAYVVYNGYGDLQGYTGARLVAYLASKTYKRISFFVDGQYINGATGYLVADQDVIDGIDTVSITNLNRHTKVSA